MHAENEPAATPPPHIELIQGSMDQFGGYAIDGRRYLGEAAEALVDEAKEMAMHQPGRSFEDVLAFIVPLEQLVALA